MNAKQIERIDYGTPQQMREADIWYDRFVKFTDSHPTMSEAVWHRLHSNDIWYLARRRWMERQGV